MYSNLLWPPLDLKVKRACFASLGKQKNIFTSELFLISKCLLLPSNTSLPYGTSTLLCSIAPPWAFVALRENSPSKRAGTVVFRRDSLGDLAQQIQKK